MVVLDGMITTATARNVPRSFLDQRWCGAATLDAARTASFQLEKGCNLPQRTPFQISSEHVSCNYTELRFPISKVKLPMRQLQIKH